MSMSTYVVVFKSPDKEHEKMRQIYEICQSFLKSRVCSVLQLLLIEKIR